MVRIDLHHHGHIHISDNFCLDTKSDLYLRFGSDINAHPH